MINSTKDNKKLRVCAYVRVSTKSESQKVSFDEQVRYWTDTLSNNPSYIFMGVYADYGFSGKLSNRPAYKQMIYDALDGKLDLIFCSSISRFGRDLTTIINDIRRLRDKTVFVNFEINKITTDNPNFDFYLSVNSAVAQYSLRNQSNALTFSYKQKFEYGHCVCKPILGYSIKRVGYDYEFTVIPKQAETVRLIFKLYNDGMSFVAISKYLKENNYENKYGNINWTPPMIPYILSNEKYAGVVYMQKYFNKNLKTYKNNPDNPEVEMYAIEDHHEAIIPLDLFHQTKIKLDSRIKKPRQKKTKTNDRDVISEFLFCGTCNNHYKKITRKNYQGESVITYRCGKNRYKEECCHNSTVYPESFKTLFISAYNDFTLITDLGTERTKFLNQKIKDLTILYFQIQKQDATTYEEKQLRTQKLNSTIKELTDYQRTLNLELGHIVNNKKIPKKTSIYREDLLKSILIKAEVNNGKITFKFNNGVIIEKEFTNPVQGRRKKGE